MKTKYKLAVVRLLTLALLGLPFGCKDDILEEQPYTVFTTDYFKSATGLQSAVTAAYAGLRYDFGPIGALDISNMGTDEWTMGDQSLTGDAFQEGTYGLNSNDGAIQTPWNRNYWHINLCNAVVDFAPEVQMDAAAKTVLIAEARYLRAQFYLLLVQQFGAVPVNLGSGDLKFNTTPTTAFYRLPLNDVLVKDYQAMIDDLIYASANLPITRPSGAFKLSQAAALHMLAKVYLFRGYSTVKQGSDFQNAYDTAKKLINGQSTYGTALQQDFGKVMEEGNDYNSEIMFSVERMPLNNAANESPSPSTDFANKVNLANNLFNMNYQQAVPGNYPYVPLAGKTIFTSRVLQYGRPLRHFAPTKWLLETAFADRGNDSRFDNSFRMVWKADTYDAAGTDAYKSYVSTINSYGLAIGDTAIYLTNTDKKADSLKALAGAQQKKYFVVGPSQFFLPSNRTLNVYPNLKKYDSKQRANFQDASGRPFPVSKLSETYLLAAEAAMQTGKSTEAVDLINVLKKRAAYRPGLTTAQVDARYAQIKVNSASQITLDYIMDERTRELCGESLRWPDLAVRGILVDRLKTRNPDAAPKVQPFHMLRPIPQSQLDALQDANKAQYQNPGY
ncbi:RagB/SusD family nutrient uptake outer membrane protein [Spirosoma sp. KCTC 42546]|uniref:RagB/SusD family nutrient uptake outer membrane protein n=1 Tax=Spirosoma sp. KCTC 42546 TaxID=2520506 RepID=UPI0011576209|nr:RagB/SusD family nutrient uptake outer membrane protein [Spirosoma sp. KCTC 42546]QDK77697.1 RagB/SusD family nutrient uptake outer membrane protein [Spirosoma sp. KCTC 42546]